MSKIFDINSLNCDIDIQSKLKIICDFLDKDCSYQLKSLHEEEKQILLDRLIKVLTYLKENDKLYIISDVFIKDTKWFSQENNYVDTLYAIYLPQEYKKENEDDYLVTLSNIILKSTIGFLNNKSKNYQVYFNNLYEVLRLYAICYMFLRRDIDNGIINTTEKHFFEIVLATFLSHYYANYDNIDQNKIISTINEICNYQVFIEKWTLNGITKKYHGSYEKEKLIAKTLFDNIDTPKKKIIV